MTYSEKNIQRFAGLLGIRKKPTPYIGPSDSDGLWTCLREPADNCVDQALAGRNSLVHIIVEKPGVYWVLDEGPGIPTGMKVFADEHGRKEKLNTLYVVTGLTHGGSNFDSDVISRGTHGIGQKATNAMSKRFTVWTFREGQWYSIEYADAKLSQDVAKSKAPRLPHGLKAKLGTVTRFEPDMSLFHKGSRLDRARVIDWCELTSYLVKGLTVKFTDEKGKTTVFKTKGPQEYLEKRIESLKATLTGKPFVFSGASADIAVGFTDAEGTDLVACYTNGLHNKEGGEHLKALVAALVKSLEPYKGKLQYTPSDVRDGLLGLVNYKIAAPKFNNQPKDALIDDRVYDAAFPVFLTAWSEFWAKNKSMAKDVCARAALLRSKTADFLKDKKLVKNVNAAKKRLNSKIAGVVGNAPVEDRELYIVEGDSAGGGCVRRRNKSFQAIYPLKGKPLNCFPGDTLVQTSDGLKRIDSSVSEWEGPGLNVGSGEVSRDRFSPAFSSKSVTELLVLTFEDGHVVECTPDHLFLTTVGYVAACELTSEHELVSILRRPSKVVGSSLRQLDTPVPVYDVTNLSGHSNFVLANGVVVHNCMDTAKDKINKNAEVVGLLAALGVDLSGKSNGPAQASYGKIILLADADVDGAHINVLILGVLYRFMPQLLANGQVYTVRSPLYKGRHKDKVYFGMTQDEVWAQAGSKIDLTYLKGWGEVSPDDLGVALDPAQRVLIRITEADKAGRKAFEQLLGKSPAFRKTLLGVE